MRTTITLDPDVEQLLKNTMRERDITFKDAVNDGLRVGLTQPLRERPRFRQKTYAMGTGKPHEWDKALQIAEQLEDEEILRKLALGR